MKNYNNAGKLLTVDRVKELRPLNVSGTIGSMINRQQQIQGSQTADRFSRLQMEVVGNRELTKTTTTFVVYLYDNGVLQTSLPSTDFTWTRPNHSEGWTEVKGRVLSISASDIVESPEMFTCVWRFTDETGVSREKSVSINCTYATIRQYLWSNGETEDEINKNDSSWSDEQPEQPANMRYLWVRESTDNGETWTYYRSTGTSGWSQATVQLFKRSTTAPETFDGGATTYDFASGALAGDLGTWSTNIPEGDGEVYAVFGSFRSQNSTATIQANEWTIPTLVHIEGTQGEPGVSAMSLNIYIRSEETPALPTENAYFSFTTNMLTGVAPWSQTVPVGNGRCWVSSVTISSNTGTAVIPPNLWSAPAIFIENGEQGVGIESLEKEYAIGTDRVTIPTGPWTELAPEISEDQILWERTKVTLTNGVVEYTGYAPVTGNDGAPAPEVLVKYAWSKSNKIPPKPAYWVWRNALMAFSNKLIGNPQEIWLSNQTTKPSGTWHLWMRTSSDGGKTWSRGQCISGDDAASFSIDGPQSFVTDRGMVIDSTSLTFTITRVNGLEGTCVWTLDSASIGLGVRFNGNSTEGSGDTIDVVIPPQTTIGSIVVTATVGGLVRDRKVMAMNKAVTIEYFGTYPRWDADGNVINQPETAKGGKPFTTGDHFTFLYTDEVTGENLSTIYAYVVTGESTGVWVDTSNPNEYESVLEDMMYQIVMDGVYDITNAANNGDYQPANNGKAWSMFMGIGAVQVVAEKIFTQYLKVNGAIYGGDVFNKYGEYLGSGTGFHMNAEGLLQAMNAIIYGRIVNPSLETEVGRPQIDSTTVLSQYASSWNNINNRQVAGNGENDYQTYGPSCKYKYIPTGGYTNYMYWSFGKKKSLDSDVLTVLVLDPNTNEVICGFTTLINLYLPLKSVNARGVGNAAFALGTNTDNNYGTMMFYYKFIPDEKNEEGQWVGAESRRVSITSTSIKYIYAVVYSNGYYIFICGSSGGAAYYFRLTEEQLINGQSIQVASLGTVFGSPDNPVALLEYDGNIFAVIKTSARTPDSTYIYKSTDNGNSFSKICSVSGNFVYSQCLISDSGDLYAGKTKIANLATGTPFYTAASGSTPIGGLRWAKKVNNEYFACYVDDETGVASLERSSDLEDWETVLTTSDFDLDEDGDSMYIDGFADICMSCGEYIVAYENKVSFRDVNTFAQKSSWSYAFQMSPSVVSDDKGLCYGAINEYAGVDLRCSMETIYDFLTDVNGKLPEDSSAKKTFEPLSLLTPCSGTLQYGNNTQVQIAAMSAGNNEVVVVDENAGIHRFKNYGNYYIKILNLVIEATEGSTRFGNLIPFTDLASTIGSSTNRILRIYLQTLEVESIYASKLPEEKNAVEGYLYVDENNFVKLKEENKWQ